MSERSRAEQIVEQWLATRLHRMVYISGGEAKIEFEAHELVEFVRHVLDQEAAAVLRELVEIHREIAAEGWSLDLDISWDRAMGNAYTLVEAARKRLGGEQ